MKLSPCPNCRSSNSYKSVKPVSAGGGYAPNYLPGLGGVVHAEKFQVVLCADCGFTRFFASEKALSKVSVSKKWERV
jgi:predicted nucleic-acid-binding Zn-ribbon protein